MSLLPNLESISESTLSEETRLSGCSTELIEFEDSAPEDPSTPDFFPVDLVLKECVILPWNDVQASRLFEQVRYDWLLPKPGGWLSRWCPKAEFRFIPTQSPPLWLTPGKFDRNFWRAFSLR